MREKLFSIAQTAQNYSAITWVVELKEGSSDSEISARGTFLVDAATSISFPPQPGMELNFMLHMGYS